MTQITQLLDKVHAGDAGALDALFASIYDELRRLARARLREGGRDTVLETTSLVNECYLRLVQAGELRAQGKRAFFSYVSQVMRSVIVDNVRQRQAARRGGDVLKLALSTELEAELVSDEDTILKVHEALKVLEQADARLAQVVQMRYFGGYRQREIAEILGTTQRTVQRDWKRARAILAVLLK